jgi:hypothetical protein
MLFALTGTFEGFQVRMLLSDSIRLTLASIAVLGAGFAASHLPMPAESAGRLFVLLKLVEVSVACVIVAWPALLLTGSISVAEKTALFAAFLKRSRPATSPLPQEVAK